ncbi:MAG TPA: rhodanese-like domain-containing protein [Anaerolineales bacterium]|nr:rhodanese-like domain-containing protein [Anaerolineales bacterium]
MLVKQFVDEGLGNSSYLIAAEESGQAAVLDPERDVDRYLQTAEGLGLRIIYALDTHLHNDFVSGSREIAAQAGAQVGASIEARVDFEHLPLSEGYTLDLGGVRIATLSTPGHTPEHISFVVYEAGKPAPAAVFSGGALIVGGAARTDLLGQELAAPLARQLHHSIHDKLMGLPNEATVYPTHGAGSFCAAPSSRERISTIGREKLWNPLAQAADEGTFVELSLSGLPSYPTYFKYLRAINQRGPALLGGVPVLKPLNPKEVLQLSSHGAAILDTRPPQAFAAGHIPGSYGIPLGAPLITWAGWVIPFGSPLILISSDEKEREAAVRQLIRIGYDDLRGSLLGGMEAWEAEAHPVARTPAMLAQELAERLEQGKAPLILDVRSDAEWRAGHLPGAIHIEAGRLPFDDLPLPKEELKVIHCGHSDRSMVGISVLEQRGYRNLVLLAGGYSKWQAAGYRTVRET